MKGARDMVVNVAAFTEGEAREALLKYTDIRIIALKVLYSIPEYPGASLAAKNWLYDELKSRIEAAYNLRA